MRDDLDQFVGQLVQAASKIADGYFQLPVANGDLVYRERVYCYELYHQLRRLWDDGSPYSLGGEVDKHGHPFFRDGPYAQSKPDFLVHRPGDMVANLAVVEVKPATLSAVEAVRDLDKLAWFCANAHYAGGIQLVYGQPTDRAVLEAHAQEVRRRVDAGVPLVLLWHADAGQEPRRS